MAVDDGSACKGRSVVRASRRLALTLALMAVATLLASGLAWAAIIDGTDAADTISGTQYGDVIDALGGNDTVYGRAGADNIKGGDGDDQLFGGGRDQDIAGDGGSIIDGGLGNDTIVGSSGADTLKGGAGNDTIFDAVIDDAAAEIMYGGDGDDVITAVSSPKAQDKIVSCGAGRDVVYVDNLDTVPSDCEIVRNAFADVSFGSPVSVAEALQMAAQTSSWVMTLEDDYAVGGEPTHDFFIGPTTTDAATTAQAYERERLGFYQDMVNDHNSADLTAGERAEDQAMIDAMKAALAKGDAGEIKVTAMTLNGNEQQLRNLTSGTISGTSSGTLATSAGNIESVSIVDMSANDEQVEQEEALEQQALATSEPPEGSLTAASSTIWYPVRGRSKVAASSIAGKRYVSQRFTWSSPPPGATVGACCGYEHDFKTQNNDGRHYLTGAQTPSYRGCFPKNAFASTSYPRGSYAYLESNLTSRGTCERTQLTYTIGIANTAPVAAGKRYYTFIRTPNGNAGSDKAKLFGELLHRVPEDCYSVYCVYNAKGPRVLLDPSTDWPWFGIPSTKPWTE